MINSISGIGQTKIRPTQNHKYKANRLKQTRLSFCSAKKNKKPNETLPMKIGGAGSLIAGMTALFAGNLYLGAALLVVGWGVFTSAQHLESKKHAP